MKLFVDDMRKAPEGWHVARSNERAIALLAKGFVDEVSLDHDIIGSPEESFTPVAYYISVMPESLRPKIVYIHTGNETGYRKMEAILDGIVQVYRDRTEGLMHNNKEEI